MEKVHFRRNDRLPGTDKCMDSNEPGLSNTCHDCSPKGTAVPGGCKTVKAKVLKDQLLPTGHGVPFEGHVGHVPIMPGCGPTQNSSHARSSSLLSWMQGALSAKSLLRGLMKKATAACHQGWQGACVPPGLGQVHGYQATTPEIKALTFPLCDQRGGSSCP